MEDNKYKGFSFGDSFSFDDNIAFSFGDSFSEELREKEAKKAEEKKRAEEEDDRKGLFIFDGSLGDMKTKKRFFTYLDQASNWEELSDLMVKLVRNGHKFERQNVDGYDVTGGFQFGVEEAGANAYTNRNVATFYNAIAREQRQLKTQEMLASQFARGKNGQKALPRDIWNTIFFRRRQQELCRGLQKVSGPALLYLTAKLRLPTKDNKGHLLSIGHLCAQLAAFLVMGDYAHPDKLTNYVTERLNKILALARELGIEVAKDDQGNVDYAETGLQFIAALSLNF